MKKRPSSLSASSRQIGFLITLSAIAVMGFADKIGAPDMAKGGCWDGGGTGSGGGSSEVASYSEAVSCIPALQEGIALRGRISDVPPRCSQTDKKQNFHSITP